jgi:hypothetical protein
LLRIYAKCIDGQDAIAKRRISRALNEEPDASPAPAALVGERSLEAGKCRLKASTRGQGRISVGHEDL